MGCKDKYTMLKAALVEGLELAARKRKLKGGVGELVQVTFEDEPIGVLKIAAGQIPKDLNIGGQADNPVQFAPVEVIVKGTDDS
ncbi:MAG TPA: hypothetical protein ENH62_15070 [Marinobacter sp.]|nr:hypothetical protein [Marinobacter sp.]